ncbi:MAG: hypothetical protein M0Q53_05360 [Prolixibacteraceae bacterium]|jgi:hypothetical protein|nr:hypothetical protein [Prolixibacteraceae bacterium]
MIRCCALYKYTEKKGDLSYKQARISAISIKIKDPHNKSKDLLIPIDTNSPTEYELTVKKDLRLQGMGSGKRKEEPPPVQGTLF